MLTYFTFFAQLERKINFPQSPCKISHLTLTLVPRYLGKIRILLYRKTMQDMYRLHTVILLQNT